MQALVLPPEASRLRGWGSRWLILVVLTSLGAVELTGQQHPQVLVVPLVAAYLIGQCVPREVGQCLPHKQCICC